MRAHWSSPFRSFSTYRANANTPKDAAILASFQNFAEAMEEKKEPELSFLKNNPMLRSKPRAGPVYGGTKCPEQIQAEDIEDYMKRSDMPTIMRKLLEREKQLDEKLTAELVNSLHDRDGALLEQLYSRLLSDRTSRKKSNASQAQTGNAVQLTNLQYNLMLGGAATTDNRPLLE